MERLLLLQWLKKGPADPDHQKLIVCPFHLQPFPGAGKDGGQVIFNGRVADILNSENSITGQFLKKYLQWR